MYYYYYYLVIKLIMSCSILASLVVSQRSCCLCITGDAIHIGGGYHFKEAALFTPSFMFTQGLISWTPIFQTHTTIETKYNIRTSCINKPCLCKFFWLWVNILGPCSKRAYPVFTRHEVFILGCKFHSFLFSGRF